MDRIEVNVRTGERSIIPMTQAEIDAAAARSAAEASDPKLIEYSARKQLLADAKATAMFTALENASLAQINTWVDNNFAGMNATQRAFLKLLAASAGMYLREK